MAEETKDQEISRRASEGAKKFGVDAGALEGAIKEELKALVAEEIALDLFGAKGGKQTRATWGRRSYTG